MLLCANALFFRNGQPCEDCLSSTPLLGLVRRCYRDSFVASAAVVRMASVNRQRSTWRSQVNAFITPSEHARSRFLAAGFPEPRMFVKPNVVPDFGVAQQTPSASLTLVYVGRLSAEKGIALLLRAWASATKPPASRLLLVGGEQNPGEFSANAANDVTFLGHIETDQVGYFLGQARAVVLPSLCYETFGNTVVEAFSRGRAAIVSDIGALSRLVQDGRTGFTFPPGDASALAHCIETMLTRDTESDAMGTNARAEYVLRFSEDATYDELMKIYRFALASAQAAHPTGMELRS